MRDRITAKMRAGAEPDRAELEAVREARAFGCNVTAPRDYVRRKPAPATTGRSRDDQWWK